MLHSVSWLYLFSCTTLLFSLACNCPDLSFTWFSMYLSLFYSQTLWQKYNFLLNILTHIKLCLGLILFLVLWLQFGLSLTCETGTFLYHQIGNSLGFLLYKLFYSLDPKHSLFFFFLVFLPHLDREHPLVVFWGMVHRRKYFLDVYVWSDFWLYPHTWLIVWLHIKLYSRDHLSPTLRIFKVFLHCFHLAVFVCLFCLVFFFRATLTVIWKFPG